VLAPDWQLQSKLQVLMSDTIAWFAFLYGVLLVGFALRLRKHAQVKI
jgi:hypothetical protein